MLKTQVLFVSHPHIDHIGGLANLHFCMDKVHGRNGKEFFNNNTLDVLFPDFEILSAIRLIVTGRAGGEMKYNINEHRLTDGVIFADKNLRVTAMHNRHFGNKDALKGCVHSLFLLETDGKKIVFSGDVAKPCELDELIGNGVDVLIMEAGHHRVIDICEYASSRNVKNLRFNHHGRAIIEKREANEKITAEFARENGIFVCICSKKRCNNL